MSLLGQSKKNVKSLTTKDIDAFMPDWREMGLNVTQSLFVIEYLTNGFNATAAFKAAGYTASTNSSAGVRAHQLLKKEKVRKFVRKYIDGMLQQKTMVLDKQIIDVLYRQTFYDIAMFINADGSPKFKRMEDIPKKWRCCIDSIESKYFGKDADVKQTTVKLVSRDRAMEKLVKYLEIFNTNIGIDINISEDKSKLLEDIFNSEDIIDAEVL